MIARFNCLTSWNHHLMQAPNKNNSQCLTSIETIEKPTESQNSRSNNDLSKKLKIYLLCLVCLKDSEMHSSSSQNSMSWISKDRMTQNSQWRIWWLMTFQIFLQKLLQNDLNCQNQQENTKRRLLQKLAKKLKLTRNQAFKRKTCTIFPLITNLTLQWPFWTNFRIFTTITGLRLSQL